MAVLKEQTGASHSFTQGITVDNTVPTVSISSLGGDGIINIPETQAGVKISGSTNAEVGSKIKISLLKASDNSEFTNFGTHEVTVLTPNNWELTLPTENFPQESFKIKAEVTNTSGNSSDTTSDAIPVDFSAPTATISDNISGTATGDVTYTISFDQNVSYFSSNAVSIVNGTVSSVSGSGKSYTVVVTPNADAEGNVSFAMNPNGGAKDASGNNLNIQLGSGNSNALSYSQAFDTKARLSKPFQFFNRYL